MKAIQSSFLISGFPKDSESHSHLLGRSSAGRSSSVFFFKVHVYLKSALLFRFKVKKSRNF